MQDPIAHNKQTYNAIAKHFSETRSYVWEDLVPLVEYVKGGDSVLDLACGNGRLYQLIEKKAIESGLPISYLGVDFSEELLSQARAKWQGAHFEPGTMTDIPCEDGRFDVVFCLASFHHLPDDMSRKQCLSEVYRVLKSGGTFVMTNWHIYSNWAQEKLASGKWRYGSNEREIVVPWKDQDGQVIGDRFYYAFKPEELKQLLSDAGFFVEPQYFSPKKGAAGTGEGMNIVTVCKKVV